MMTHVVFLVVVLAAVENELDVLSFTILVVPAQFQNTIYLR